MLFFSKYFFSYVAQSGLFGSIVTFEQFLSNICPDVYAEITLSMYTRFSFNG